MRILLAMVIAGAPGVVWLVQADPAAAQTRHMKHRPARTMIPYHRRYVEVPAGYTLGGPNYTTCDRINRDRMLVGTCR